jgi:hypothetical protein
LQLHEFTPNAAWFALLVNPANPVAAETITKDAEAAARKPLLSVPIRSFSIVACRS